jgi:ribonuclease HI
VSQLHKVTGTWVRGHDGHEENERCDKIAREIAEKFKNHPIKNNLNE